MGKRAVVRIKCFLKLFVFLWDSCSSENLEFQMQFVAFQRKGAALRQTCLGSMQRQTSAGFPAIYGRLSCKLLGSALRQWPNAAFRNLQRLSANYGRLSCKLQRLSANLSQSVSTLCRATCCSVRAATLQSRLSKKVAFSTNQVPIIAAFRIYQRLSAQARPCAKPRGVGLAPVTRKLQRLSATYRGRPCAYALTRLSATTAAFRKLQRLSANLVDSGTQAAFRT